MFWVVVLEYGNQLGGGGAFDHPDGGTCALQCRCIVGPCDEDEALRVGIEFEKDPMVHYVTFEEVA